MPDKRKHRRVSIEPLPCRVFLTGEVFDLSIGGAFVASEHPLPRGSTVMLELALPGERTIRVKTEVKWAGDYFHGQGPQPCPGMGLSFLEMEPADRIALTRFVTRRYAASHAALRLSTGLPARIASAGAPAWGWGLVREISERGLFLETDEPAMTGTEVGLQLRLPNAIAPIEVRGIVVEVVAGAAVKRDRERANEGPIDPLDGPPGLRIELTEASLRAREFLQSFVEEAREEAT